MWRHLVRGTCKNPHEDWVAEFLEAEKAINEAMNAPIQKEFKTLKP